MATMYRTSTFSIPYNGGDCIVLAIQQTKDDSGEIQLQQRDNTGFVAYYSESQGLLGELHGDWLGIASMTVNNGVATVTVNFSRVLTDINPRCCLIPVENGW